MSDRVHGRINGAATGVVLLQLGGPDSLEAVEPFLYNLFCDPDIIDLPIVEEYCEQPDYIAAIVHNVRIALKRVPGADRGAVHLVFSAHGTPMSLVRAGDPYQQQVIRTYAAVLKAGNFELPHTLCYQSKVGPQKWLEPSLSGTVRSLASDKITHLIVVPLAFVSDHSETLWESNIETRREAQQLGVRYFDMSPALNTNPAFIRALRRLVLAQLV